METKDSSASLLELLSVAAEQQQQQQQQNQQQQEQNQGQLRNVKLEPLPPQHGHRLSTSAPLIRISEEQEAPTDEDIDSLMDIVSVRCKKCQFMCTSKEEFRNHVRQAHSNHIKDSSPPLDAHGEKKFFICGGCSMAFHSIQACRVHMLKVHKKRVPQRPTEEALEPALTSSPPVVPEPTIVPSKESVPIPKPSQELVEEPNQVKTDEEKKRCSKTDCSFRFSDEDLEIHLKCHNVDDEGEDEKSKNPFQCFLCQQTFDDWGKCSLHLWSSHQEDVGLVTCSLCSTYKTTTLYKLERHMATHKMEKLFKCGTCGKGFNQVAQMRNHSITHLNKDSDLVPLWYSKKQCEICKQFFSDSKCLKKHVQVVHSKLKRYICNICNHQSARKSMLELHMRQHTGEKPFKCDQCEFKTGDPNSLRKHIMGLHQGIKNYKCPLCDYASTYSQNLKNHIHKKHPDEENDYVLSCHICSFKTMNKESYFSHTSNHEHNDSKKDDDSFKNPVPASHPKDEKKNKSTACLIKTEEEDSLHATMDFGGTTIPATTNE